MDSYQTSPRQSSYNINYKTIFLFVILICACCLLSIGYNFQIDYLYESGTSMVACCLLVLFLFYIFYEFFKSDTCDDLNKTGWERLKSSAGRGTTYFGQQLNRGASAFGNAVNNYMPQFEKVSRRLKSHGQQFTNNIYPRHL